MVDMHIHTKHSDGLFSVKEIIEKAVAAGLEGIAITDHDSFDGIAEALEIIAKNELPLHFIAGAEFSTHHPDIGEIHILGYFDHSGYKKMKPYLNEFKKMRRLRAKRILDCLKQNGMTINIDKYMDDRELPVGRMHIARKLVEDGFYKDVPAAFNKMLKNGATCYIPKTEIHTVEVIREIKKNGGKAIVAHPVFLTSRKRYAILEQFVREGLDGFEAIHPKVSTAIRYRLEQIAQNSGLMTTGGSDFHGDHYNRDFGKYGVELKKVIENFSNFVDIL